ncbi:MAG: hypothetical protein ACKOEX_02195 [Planctomycetia bacterium]
MIAFAETSDAEHPLGIGLGDCHLASTLRNADSDIADRLTRPIAHLTIHHAPFVKDEVPGTRALSMSRAVRHRHAADADSDEGRGITKG